MSEKKVLLLGLGMQGKASLYDLVLQKDTSQIIVVDNDPELKTYLNRYPPDIVQGRNIDVSDESKLSNLMKDVDVVIEALPGILALPVGRLAAREGVNLVSSMYYINPGESDTEKIKVTKQQIADIDREAKAKQVTILTEFGLDPGIDLVLGAKALKELDEVDEFYSYGAGLPSLESADNPLQYKFSWSVIGVMRAYLRPAITISKGRMKEIAAHEMFAKKNIHLLELEEIGSALECYPNGNSEHYAELFSIRDTIKEMTRYSCRYPGHCAFWEIMAKSGFLNEKPIKVGDRQVSPVQFTASLLGSQPQFHYAEHDLDITLIRVDVRGTRKGEKRRIVFQLIDRRDLKTGFTSMQRTVGFTMSLGARLILEGRLNKKGLLTPLDVPYDLLIQGLEKHGIHIMHLELPWK